jgi:hypothetical protein
MKLSRLYRFVLLATAGGMLFQTANTSCTKQIFQTLGTSFAESLGPALVTVITSALQNGTGTTGA